MLVAAPALTLYTDGGARGNPGPAAIGVLLVDATGKELDRHCGRIGRATNNQAEYQALITGLHRAARHTTGSLTCISDSQLIINQMQGKFKVRNTTLADLHAAAKKATQAFHNVSFHHVPRAHPQIQIVDQLVNEALDSA